jgi:hypothetical protein
MSYHNSWRMTARYRAVGVDCHHSGTDLCTYSCGPIPRNVERKRTASICLPRSCLDEANIWLYDRMLVSLYWAMGDYIRITTPGQLPDTIRKNGQRILGHHYCGILRVYPTHSLWAGYGKNPNETHTIPAKLDFLMTKRREASGIPLASRMWPAGPAIHNQRNHHEEAHHYRRRDRPGRRTRRGAGQSGPGLACDSTGQYANDSHLRRRANVRLVVTVSAAKVCKPGRIGQRVRPHVVVGVLDLYDR